MEARDRISISVSDIQAQRERFLDAASTFAAEYARGQGMWTGLRTLTARVTRSETPAQRISRLATNLQDEQAYLVEFLARSDAQRAANDIQFRQILADRAATHQINLTRRVTRIIQRANSTQGEADNAYRTYISEEGDGGKFLTTALLGTPPILGLVSGDLALASFLGAIGAGGVTAMDVSRRMYLRTTTRNADGLNNSSNAELGRRVASLAEAEITGDEQNLAAIQNQILNEKRLRGERAVARRLESDQVGRPNYMLGSAHPDNVAARNRIRRAIREALAPQQQETELIRSRDVARGSRQIRTLAALGLVTGLTAAFFLRPQAEVPPPPAPYCGAQDIDNPDEVLGNQYGVRNVSSLEGIAQNIWFRRITGRDFNPDALYTSGPFRTDREQYNAIWNLDPEGNQQLVDALVAAQAYKNRAATEMVTRDWSRHTVKPEIGPRVPVSRLCEDEISDIYDQITRNRFSQMAE